MLPDKQKKSYKTKQLLNSSELLQIRNLEERHQGTINVIVPTEYCN